MGCSRIVFILLTVQSVYSDSRPDYNFSGADYDGKCGKFNYAIFASIGVPRSKAIKICEAIYPGGRLAWMGDTELKTTRDMLNHLLSFHYMSFNTYFWIDGYLKDPKCVPQNTSCIWIPAKSSLIGDHSKKMFKNDDVVFHTPQKKLEKFWPVVVPNKNDEYGVGKEFILSAAPEKEEIGFICTYRKRENRCPVGYSPVKKNVPRHLYPVATTITEICGSNYAD
nr:protocadherin 1 [Hymenolepis microstoma]